MKAGIKNLPATVMIFALFGVAQAGGQVQLYDANGGQLGVLEDQNSVDLNGTQYTFLTINQLRMYLYAPPDGVYVTSDSSTNSAFEGYWVSTRAENELASDSRCQKPVTDHTGTARHLWGNLYWTNTRATQGASVAFKLEIAACGGSQRENLGSNANPRRVSSQSAGSQTQTQTQIQIQAQTPANAGGGDIASIALNKHNQLRAAHCVAPLQWDARLASTAQAWANNCKFEHSSNGLGENLAIGTSGYFPPDTQVQNWYDEIKDYNFSNGGFSMQTGHFTQVIWRSTTHVGCGVAQCSGQDLLVCNYSPPGNYQGQFQQNVPQRCQ
jgi:uncharacterized protein YkwD